jgi:hypothetical protein
MKRIGALGLAGIGERPFYWDLCLRMQACDIRAIGSGTGGFDRKFVRRNADQYRPGASNNRGFRRMFPMSQTLTLGLAQQSHSGVCCSTWPANAAPGPALVTLLGFPHTSLADGAGNNIEFIGSNATITITPASLPEPAMAWLIAGGLMLFGGRLRVRRG